MYDKMSKPPFYHVNAEDGWEFSPGTSLEVFKVMNEKLNKSTPGPFSISPRFLRKIGLHPRSNRQNENYCHFSFKQCSYIREFRVADMSFDIDFITACLG